VKSSNSMGSLRRPKTKILGFRDVDADLDLSIHVWGHGTELLIGSLKLVNGCDY